MPLGLGGLVSPLDFLSLSYLRMVFNWISSARLLIGCRAHSVENFYYKEGDFSDLTCENLIIGHGAEDIAVTKDGLAFITSGLMYPPFR